MHEEHCLTHSNPSQVFTVKTYDQKTHKGILNSDDGENSIAKPTCHDLVHIEISNNFFFAHCHSV